MGIFKVCAIVATLAVALLAPHLGSSWFRLGASFVRRLARRPTLAVVLVGLLAFGGSAGVSLLVCMPRPIVLDEFSYLLAADTFAHGRLTNPPHPLWVHFESFHIIQQPTYASKYPPAQGLVLALGQVITGYPIAGVWLSAGLMCASICWMLFAWLPPPWAVLGGMLTVVRLGVASYWSQSYWGGAVAAFGGALVFGALPRVVARPRARHAVLMGLGLATMANSRPYEGLLASVPAMVLLLSWMAGRDGPPVGVSLRRIVLPLAVVIGLTAAAMGFYNLRVTGNPIRQPYSVWTATYGLTRTFQSGVPTGKTFRHKVMNDFAREWERRFFPPGQSLYGMVRERAEMFSSWPGVFLGPFLLLPLVALPQVVRRRWMGFAALTCGVVTAGVFMLTRQHAHYVAPITGLIFVLVLQGMRHLRAWRWRGKPSGRFLVRAIPVLCILALMLSLGGQRSSYKCGCFPWAADRPVSSKPGERRFWTVWRARLLTQLKQDGEHHLVVVRYGPHHHFDAEWVYNDADIDAATIVWAREMDDPSENQKLINYFKDRRVWLLTVDQDKARPELVPYPGELTAQH